jgi:DNA repair exonuclease SbcCD ATPase subunit
MSMLRERLDAAYEAINKLADSYRVAISRPYFDLKLQELRLTFEYQEKLKAEKDEQRRIQDQIREEEKAQREIEKALRDAENEEERFEKALARARAEVATAQGTELERMNQKIALLEAQLKEAQANKERAISRAQLTKSGHVYIISNIGSFGENKFKIGMTRRLDPMDRVKELGDASVPFEFDVHAIIYTENAPALEGKLHDHFAERRINLINERKEFFEITIDELTAAVASFDGTIELIKVPEARDYRETLAIRASRRNGDQLPPLDSPVLQRRVNEAGSSPTPGSTNRCAAHVARTFIR